MTTAVSHKWSLFQLNVNTAFFYGNLIDEVYVQLLLNLDLPPPSIVCKLQKYLYGLKQKNRQWNIKFIETLISYGYEDDLVL